VLKKPDRQTRVGGQNRFGVYIDPPFATNNTFTFSDERTSTM